MAWARRVREFGVAAWIFDNSFRVSGFINVDNAVFIAARLTWDQLTLQRKLLFHNHRHKAWSELSQIEFTILLFEGRNLA